VGTSKDGSATNTNLILLFVLHESHRWEVNFYELPYVSIDGRKISDYIG
jgi:hypothetical protein